MIDIDPRLDERLSAFYEQIEASRPPSQIFDVAAAPMRERRSLTSSPARLIAAVVVPASRSLRSS